MKSLEIALSSRATSSLATMHEALVKQIRAQVVPPSAIEALQAATSNVALTKLNVLNTMQPFAKIAAIQSAQIEQALAPTLRTHRLLMESIAQSVQPISIPRSAFPALNFSVLYQSLEINQQWGTLAAQIYKQAAVDLPEFDFEEIDDPVEEQPQDAPSTSIEQRRDFIKTLLCVILFISLQVGDSWGEDPGTVILNVATSFIELLISERVAEGLTAPFKDYDPT